MIKSSVLFIYGVGVVVMILLWLLPVALQVPIFIAYAFAVTTFFAHVSPLHPNAWFGLFFALYSVNYPLFMLTTDYGLMATLEEVLPLSFAGFYAFMLGAIAAPLHVVVPARLKLAPQVLQLIIIASILLGLALLLFTMSLGLSNKRQFVDTIRGLGLMPLFLIFQVLIIAAICLVVRRWQSGNADGAFTSPLVLAAFGMIVLAFLVTGERDLPFRMVLLAFLTHSALTLGRRYRWWYYPGMALVAVYVMPIFQSLKGVLLPDATVGSGGGTITSIWWNEFASAGRNLHMILQWDVPLVGGETFVNAFARFFDFLGTGAESSTMWYNQTIRNDYGEGGTSGWGFSLVADSYINFGLLSVFALFFIIGLITAALYRGSGRRGFGFIFYLLFIPTLAYTIRADLANLLSLAFKVNTVMVGAVFLLSRFLVAVSAKTARPPA